MTEVRSPSQTHHGDAPAPRAAAGGVPLAPPSVFSFSAKYFCCTECRAFLDDPVCLVPAERGFACRTCANTARQDSTELPPAFALAMAELRSLQKQFGDNSDAMPRKVIRGKRPMKASDAFQSPQKLLDPATNVFVHIVQSAMQPANVATASAAVTSPDGADHHSSAPSSSAAVLFQGTTINPNVEQGKAVTPAKQAVAAPASVSPTANAPPAILAPAIDTRRELERLIAMENSERSHLDGIEALDFLELSKKRAQNHRAVQSRRPGSSKKLKSDADDRYEKADYPVAVDLYTRAIQAQPIDGLTKLSVLFGNRSAAFYMAGRYAECVEDCMKVTDVEPENTKMFGRAAKAATAMGDLAQAQSIISMAKGDGAQEQLAADKQRLTQGCELLARAQQLFGRPEGDEYWQMLVSQFAEARFFRLRFSESLARQGKYDRAAEALAPIVGTNRTPEIAMSMARNWFYGGFEFIEKARMTLEEFPQSEECCKLLALIMTVHEAKERGNALFGQKDFSGSVEQYTKAIEADPSNGRILRILYCNRAAAQKELGRYREGIEDCGKAIKLDPNFSKAYARRARCLQLQNDYANAIRDFRKAIELDPSDHELVRELKSAETHQLREAEREKDLYYVLGVQRTATEVEVKKKYREMSLKWHPDKWVMSTDEEKAQAERKFKLVCEAHSTLIDGRKRKEYDLKVEREHFMRTGGGFHSNFPAGASDAFFTRHNGGRQPGQRPPTGNFW